VEVDYRSNNGVGKVAEIFLLPGSGLVAGPSSLAVSAGLVVCSSLAVKACFHLCQKKKSCRKIVNLFQKVKKRQKPATRLGPGCSLRGRRAMHIASGAILSPIAINRNIEFAVQEQSGAGPCCIESQRVSAASFPGPLLSFGREPLFDVIDTQCPLRKLHSSDVCIQR
jgi:hypothetical protein